MCEQQLCGVLPMHKPQTFTSFDVIGKLRGILHMRRLGHTGTLDPMATGVLPVLVGSAARACDLLPMTDKTYRAQVRFGFVTDTQDIWGTKTAEYPDMHVTQAALEAVLPDFTGTITQMPPMVSAVKVGGRRLYEYARQGIEVERPARQVEIHALHLLSMDEAAQQAELEITCSKGTYIRTLLGDIGAALGGGGTMTALCRTQACGFSLGQCHSFEEVEQAAAQGSIEQLLTPVDSLFTVYPALALDAAQAAAYANGVKLPLETLVHLPENAEILRIYGTQGHFCGLGRTDRAQGVLRVYKNF